MDIKTESLIRWECNNWYVRDDKLVQICTQDGGTTILNPILTKIWVGINYETEVGILWNKVEGQIDWTNFCETISKFSMNGLVRITDETNEFDIIFG